MDSRPNPQWLASALSMFAALDSSAAAPAAAPAPRRESSPDKTGSGPEPGGAGEWWLCPRCALPPCALPACGDVGPPASKAGREWERTNQGAPLLGWVGAMAGLHCWLKWGCLCACLWPWLGAQLRPASAAGWLCWRMGMGWEAEARNGGGKGTPLHIAHTPAPQQQHIAPGVVRGAEYGGNEAARPPWKKDGIGAESAGEKGGLCSSTASRLENTPCLCWAVAAPPLLLARSLPVVGHTPGLWAAASTLCGAAVGPGLQSPPWRKAARPGCGSGCPWD